MDAICLSHRHQARVRAHAAQKLAAPDINKAPPEFARLLRAFLRVEEERLRIAARMGAGGCWLAAARSFALDVLVAHAYEAAAQHTTTEQARALATHDCAIVAIGGYGRQELAPCSDLDLLFLHSAHGGADTHALIERTLHLLWDAGLTVGHKSQTVRACLASARSDPHLQTALVHARLLTGDRALFAQLSAGRARLRRKQAAALVKAARRARDERHLKHEAIIYLQEPNVKEGVGGLRDLHAALWVADAAFGCATLADLRARGLITGAEHDEVVRAYDFLLRVRNALHWLTGRKAERLALDRQSALADALGYQATPHLRASEQFMRDYYRRARELYRFGEMIFARVGAQAAQPARWFARPRRAQLADVFVVKDGQLHLDADAGQLAQNPLLGFEAVALAQAAGVECSHELRSGITEQLGAVDRGFRHSPAAAQLFLSLLRRRGRVAPALRLLHETNLLGRYLPEFARIQLLIQHDLYHHYTIDEHTLRAVAALDGLSRAQERGARPHLCAALDEVEDVGLLYLALLLHDIGKGRGRGHVQRGTSIAEKICARLQLDERSTNRVVNLVRQHVLMAHVSQRRDLRDPRTTADFAAQLGSLDELNMLLLLTYADLNAVAPGVWSEWKGALLQELYTRARTHFTAGARPLTMAYDLARLKGQVMHLLAGELPPSEIERHFALLPARYARHLDAAQAAAHLRLLARLRQETLVCAWAPHAAGHATELTIAARDRRGLFADLAGALAAHGIEILSADLNTRADSVALDALILREAATRAAVAPERRPALERALHAAAAGSLDVPAAVERWRTHNAPRRRLSVPHPRHAPVVLCSNEIAEANTVVEVRAADEPGLAYRIASVLAAAALDISCAKIATEKADALDVFYVTDAAGRKLTDDAMQALTEKLMATLTRADDGAAGRGVVAVDESRARSLAQ